MKLTARLSQLHGTVAIPASKSHTIRAVAVAAMAEGSSTIHRPLSSSDAESAVRCYRMLGAEIETSNPQAWIVKGTGGNIQSPQETIDVGNSGTTLRIALGAAALGPTDTTTTFTGDEQIQSRPIGPLLEALENLGATCHSQRNNGKAPVEVSGQLTGGTTSLEAPTSQYLTSLLLCCPLAECDSEISVTLLNEAGYVQITLDWLDKQGIRYEHEGFDRFLIRGNQRFQSYNAPVPADFSSATFFFCGAALFGNQVTLTGLDFSDSQPDKKVVDYLKAMGADIQITEQGVTVTGGALTGTEIDMNDTPDALPAMAVCGALAQGTTRLVNVPQARNKETDRIHCMAEELAKLGVDIEELPDGLVIQGGSLKAVPVKGHADHRIVMALALAGLACNEPLTVDTAEAMNVTFPNFVELMQGLGGEMAVIVDR
ncbi:3-phosphoshikimate 1-carboxyvinyltransferase [Planctomycetota bacterium]